MQTSNIVQENPAFETGKLEKPDANGLQPLNSEQLINIQQSLGFIGSYYVSIDAYGNPYAYYFIPDPYSGAPVMVIDHSVIPVFNGYCYDFIKLSDINSTDNQYCPTNSEDLASSNEDKSSESSDDPNNQEPDLGDLTNSLENLLHIYQVDLSDEQISAINVLLIQITPFSKSIILSNGLIHDKFRKIFDEILEYVKSYVKSKKFIQNEDISEIRNFLENGLIKINPINLNIKYDNKEFPRSAVYRNSNGRPTEDRKSMLRYLDLPIPNHPKVVEIQNGRRKNIFLTLKDERFPYLQYETQIDDIIMINVENNQELRKKLGCFVNIWKETKEEFGKFVKEVQQIE
jgi:hypothetical protein